MNSLRNRLRLIFIGLAVIPLMVVGIITGYQSFTVLAQEAQEEQETHAELIAEQIRSFFEKEEAKLVMLTEVRGVGSFSLDEQEVVLNSFLNNNPEHLNIVLIDDTGQTLVEVSGRSDIEVEVISGDWQDDPAFSVPVETQAIHYGSVRFDEQLLEPVITISVPITNLRTGEVSHVLVSTLRFKSIWTVFQNRTYSGTEDAYLVDAGNRIVAHRNPSVVLSENIFDLPESDGQAVGREDGNVILAMYSLELGEQSFTIVTEQSVTEAFQLAVTQVIISLVVTVVALISVVFLVAIFVSQIVNPIEQLSETAQNIASGDLTQRVEVDSQDEINELANSFNMMAEQVQESITTLEARVADRTRDLEVASEVSRQVTTVLTLDDLLPQLVKQVQEGFDLYQVALFLYEEETHSLRLEVGAGFAGDQLKEYGLILDLNAPIGTVSRSGRTGSPIITDDTQGADGFLPNPLLPDTRSEVSLPMMIGDNLLGVLNLQSDEIDHFSQEDVDVLVTLAEHITIALRNAQLFNEAEQAKEAAERSDQVKSQFLANMSHELRTPLNAILNFTAFVADGVMGEVNEEQEQALNQSIASGKHLLSLINDVLDISKIESGMMELFVQEVDFNTMLVSVTSVGKGLVKGKDIKLKTEISEDLPVSYGDKRRLRQVFLNLISNAIKFTPEGDVTITAVPEDQGFRVSITDTGIGMTTMDRDSVFESFRQAKHSNLDAVGTGLGMPISKYFVESHKGRIWFESERGKGSTFHVYLPVLTEAEANEIDLLAIEN